MTSGLTYALITGASKGLGKYFARALAARKQNLILVARSKDKLEALASELRDSHTILAESVEFDLASPGAGLQLALKLRERKLQVELLVNNAGFGERGKFWELSLERQLQMIHLHNTAVVELTHQFLPAMIAAGRGGIINVSSLAGFQPVPYAAMYSATKSFLTTFSMALREELRPTGVKVVTVCPGRLRADPEDPEAHEKRQKVPGREQRHEEVVSETLKKLESGGGLVIPGRLNRLTVRGQRLVSLNAVPKIVARLSKS
ncbi:MAG TPA: oxidoreductase [Blastocatellia bacterium]|nr:oxidoreductase [Blastocatellia bacterium]